ncbi:MAG: ArsC/Spx/MgsR family protein [Crocinitomicaceae bacterium]
MKKVYYLKSCSTCQRILKEWNLDESVILQNIKVDKMTSEQVDEMIKLAGSAERLFSRKAMKYRAMGLHEKTLTEKDYRQLIIDEYTFLKRPVLILEDQIFIGNSKAVVAEAKAAL